MTHHIKYASKAALILAFMMYSVSSLAEDNIIINNNTQPTQQSSNNCNPPQSDPNAVKQGVYYGTNPTGGIDTTITTGEKQPYIVDNNCNNNNAVIQPFVYGPVVPNRPHGRR